MDQATFDRQMMANALSMARRGLGQTAPNPSVGAVIADETLGEMIARGWTQPGGRPHAETDALRRAGDKARGGTLYVTLEPCSHHGQTGPCVDAIISAGIARVVAGIEDPDTRVAGQGFARLRTAGIEVVTGVMADDCRWVTLGHILRVTEQRPFIQLKLALDENGHIAKGANGAPAWVTGPQARAYGHLLRAEADAILVGVNTVIADDAELTCRLPGLAARTPIRVIADTHLRTPLNSKILRTAATASPVVIATACAVDAPEAVALGDAGASVLAGLPISERVHESSKLDLKTFVHGMAAKGITRLLVEGGPTLWRSFADLGLVDEVVLFMANTMPGSDPVSYRARAALDMYLGELPLNLMDRRELGPDTLWRMIVRRAD